MCVRLFRSVLVVIVTGAASTISLIASGSAASASPPAPLTFTETATRSYAGGGPASLVVVNARTATTTSDGSVLYYDSDANQIRRVDSTTRVVSPVAGNGESTTAHAPDTVASAADAALPPVDALWTDATDDIFARFCAGPNCEYGHDLYRLDAADEHWHLALRAADYAGIAVLPNGAVIAVDTTHFVLRRIDAGADPSSAGSVIAGTVNVPGSTGDGGPATSATINPGGPVAVANAGDIYFADGGWQRNVRHISPDGAISSLADDGFQSTPLNNVPSVTGLVVSKDGATLYVLRTDVLNRSQIRAVPVSGGQAHTVAGPLPACASDSTDCIGSSMTEAPVSGTTSVVVAGQNALLSWPADGSDPQAYNRYAGVLDDAKGVRSPDGVHLDEAFLSPMYDLAAAPDGSVAIATADGIRTISGLSADSVLGTAVPNVSARAMDYSADGTLYALIPDPSPHVIAMAPGTAAATVLGGGTQPVADGADGSTVQLSYFDPKIAVDPSNGDLYFDDGDSTVWSLDGSTHVVHRVGDVSAYTNRAGALGVAADHAVVVDTGSGAVQIATDGTVTPEDCTRPCPVENLHTLSDGSLIGNEANGSLVVRAVDGTVERLAVPVSSMFTLTADHRVIVPGTTGWAGGLLEVSDPMTVPTSVDAPTVQVAPEPGGVTVAVSPHATDQHIRVYAGAEGVDGQWINSSTDGDDTDTGTAAAAYTLHLRHMFTTWPDQTSTASQSTYRIEVVASESDAAGNEVFDAPQVFHVTPAADTTAPTAPTIGLFNGGTSANVVVTRPSDTDLDRVVVCKTTDGAVPTSPWGCNDIGEIPYFDNAQQTFNQWIDPTRTTTFTAFSVDASGNTSAGVSQTRAAARLVAGPAESQLAYDAQPGLEEVMWNGDWALHVRYAPGSPPTSMSDGTEAPKQYNGPWGYGAQIPVADGSQVGVSIFAYADNLLTTYRRTSFVLTGGSNSDVISLDATPTVAAGTQPSVSASVVRNVPTSGPAPVGAAALHLYRRASGSSTWTLADDASTTASGTAKFAVKAPTVTTDYQVRFNPRSIAGKVASSAIARTSVRQMLTAQLPATLKHGHTMTVTGTLSPHRSATVSLERLVRNRWVTLASRKSTNAGAYTITYRPQSTGKWTLRTTVTATPALLGGATTKKTLTVT
jgi:hypothetical protein